MRCSSLTCRHCCCRVAFAIRNCSFRTRAWHAFQFMVCQPVGWGIVDTLMCVFISLISFDCFTAFHAIKDQTEVCPLSRRGTCPVSRLLQPGIRFFRPPLPAPLTVFLAVHLPVRQRYGFTRFRLTYRGSGRVLSLHRGSLRPCAPCARGSNRTPYLLVQACQHLWPVADNGVYQQFTCVNPSDQPCSPAA